MVRAQDRSPRSCRYNRLSRGSPQAQRALTGDSCMQLSAGNSIVATDGPASLQGTQRCAWAAMVQLLASERCTYRRISVSAYHPLKGHAVKVIPPTLISMLDTTGMPYHLRPRLASQACLGCRMGTSAGQQQPGAGSTPAQEQLCSAQAGPQQAEACCRTAICIQFSQETPNGYDCVLPNTPVMYCSGISNRSGLLAGEACSTRGRMLNLPGPSAQQQQQCMGLVCSCTPTNSCRHGRLVHSGGAC